MAKYLQAERQLWVKTLFGDDVLLLTSINGTEEISRLFQYRLEMVSEHDDLDPSKIIGQTISCGLRMADDAGDRYFNGVVTAFSCHGKDDRLSFYSARIVPQFWLLSQRFNCRIFQGLSVPDIVAQVCQGIDIAAELQEKYPVLEYCVQYRESDFHFVSRLLEREGIFYFFKFTEAGHTLVLADSIKSYAPCADNIIAAGRNLSERFDEANVQTWEHRHELHSGRFVHREHRFELPSATLEYSSNTVNPLPISQSLEVYDYPGGYMTPKELPKTFDAGKRLSDVRMQELEAPRDVVLGTGNCRTFSPGSTTKVDRHYLAAEVGATYVVTSVKHEAREQSSYVSGERQQPFEYKNQFTCIPATVVFRPPRVTEKPIVHGAQTAVVVGPAGEEIYTDKYGRVKVQFFWDREGKKDANSSCWIRVAQTWAGKKWGAIFLPRIAQEVVVDFLEGDPDRPLITGSVYNDEQMPPYDLPDHKTISTIKSDSSLGSEGFNEFRFEDKKGEEQIFIHGEKNQDIRIKNDCFEWIGNNRHLVVKNTQLENIGADRNETVGRNHQEKIGADRSINIVGKEAQSIGDSLSIKVVGNVAKVFGADASEVITGNSYHKAKQIVIEALDALTIKVGGTHLTMTSDGAITLSGKTLEFKASDSMVTNVANKMSASAMDVDIEGSKSLTLNANMSAKLTSAKVDVQAQAMLNLVGGMVKINS